LLPYTTCSYLPAVFLADVVCLRPANLTYFDSTLFRRGKINEEIKGVRELKVSGTFSKTGDVCHIKKPRKAAPYSDY